MTYQIDHNGLLKLENVETKIIVRNAVEYYI